MSKQNRRATTVKAGATRTKTSRRKKRRIKWMRVAVLLFIVILIITGVIVALMMTRVSANKATKSGGKAVFGIETVVVDGNIHYTYDEIVNTSEVFVGQSVFAVNKRRAAENILAAYPYVEKVKVDSPSFTQIRIIIDEAQPIGIVHFNEKWLVLGENGKALEALEDNSERLSNYIKIKCQTSPESKVGHLMLDDRSIKGINFILSGANNYGLQNIKGIDISDFTNIRINWNNQITIAFGNDSNLEHEISIAVTALNRVLQTRGTDMRGRLDLSNYSDTDANNDLAVFTPEELLETTSEL